MGKQKRTVWAQQAHCETKHWQQQCETPAASLLAGSADKTWSSLLDLCARGAAALPVPCLGALLRHSHTQRTNGNVDVPPHTKISPALAKIHINSG